MKPEEIEQLIRMAQVLKSRARLLSADLSMAKHGPQSSIATQVAYLAEESEKKLNRILSDVLGDPC